LDKSRCFSALLLASVVFTFFVSGKVIAQSTSSTGGTSGGTSTSIPQPTDIVNSLTQLFGDPNTFVTNFQATVKDRSDQVVGLLIAASGFVYAVRVFY